MSTATSVADLEAAVLQGKTVTPAEFASAKAAEEAAVRINELQDAKRQADERANRQAEYEAKHRDLADEFDAEFEGCTDLQKLSAEITQAVERYAQEAKKQTDLVRHFVSKSEALHSGCDWARPELDIAKGHYGDASAKHGDRKLDTIPDWAMDVHRAVQAGVESSAKVWGQ